jgi:hypothetical protein
VHDCVLVHTARFAQLVPQVTVDVRSVSQPSDGEPSQSLVPGAQATHAPPEQICVCAGQMAGELHWPPDEHVWTPLPEHRVAAGAHTPVHSPSTHADAMQATLAPHCPFGSHTWTPLPEHCVVPGTHTPLHTPPTHASPAQAA